MLAKTFLIVDRCNVNLVLTALVGAISAWLLVSDRPSVRTESKQR
jgi:hypothetical protein